MKKIWKYALVAGLCAMAAGASSPAPAQIQYRSGQNVAPIYEGWLRNNDGSIDMIFAYLNRNFEEDLRVPVGPDNNIQPGGPDRGQPTIFFHRRNFGSAESRKEQFVFKVRLPKDWGPTQQMVWTVTANGKSDKVTATLNPQEELNLIVIAENHGGTIVEGNKPPSVQLTASAQSLSLPGSVTLTAVYHDDGLPKPKPAPTRPVIAATGRETTPSKGAQVKWDYFRGPAVGAVTFDPPTSPIPGNADNTTVKTVATFSQLGTYVLRAWAEDGPLIDTAEVTVTVK